MTELWRSREKDAEIELLDQMERERPPEVKMRDAVENHINMADILLQAILDVAERGREEMEAGENDNGARFGVILELLEQYRERHSRFIESLYPGKEKAA